MDLPRFFRQAAFVLVASVTGFVVCLGPALPALAQTPELPIPVIGPGVLPVTIAGNLPEAANQTYRNVYSTLTRAGVLALTNALQVFLGQMAYDAAEYIATGGKGQGKLFFEGHVGDYLANVGGDAAGEFMASLSSSQFFSSVGINLCQPSNPATMLRMQRSLGDLGSQLFSSTAGRAAGALGSLTPQGTVRPRARCDFQTVITNYQTLYHTMSNGDVVSNLERSFDPGLSQLGSLTTMYNSFLNTAQQRVTSAAADRQEGHGFQPVQGLISGNIRTPASVVEAATNENVVHKPGADQSMIVSSILQNAWEAGPAQLAAYTASIFLNTLASKFMQRIFSTGLGGGFTPSAQLNLDGPDSVAIYGTTDARNANIDLKNAPAQENTTYDVVSQMQACLSGQRGTWNCVMDQALVSAVRGTGSVGGITIAEALSRDMLHGDWRLIPSSDVKNNQDDQCFTKAYCAGNLQKMRLMRILPVGFEFAANSSQNTALCNTGDGCAKLSTVVAGFRDCNDAGELDAQHPWCHLIDPNWVITSFPQQCALTGYTDHLTSNNLPIRNQECQDIQTCLSRDSNGQCVGGYGYCMAEHTVYRFNADVCPTYAASCRIYTDANGNRVGYLRNTIDRASCDANNEGCAWYATQRVAATSNDAAWQADTSTGDRMYFKAADASQAASAKGLESCPAGDEGCTHLYAFTPGKAALNLMINGSFESIDPTTSTDALAWQVNTWADPTSVGLTPRNLTVNELGQDTTYLGRKDLPIVTPAGAAHRYTVMQRVNVVGGRAYSLSFYARSLGGSALLSSYIVPSRSATEYGRLAGMGYTANDLNALYHNDLNVVDNGDTVHGAYFQKTLGAPADITTDWQRFEYHFITPSSTQSIEFLFTGDQTAIDAVQLEEGEYATPFTETYTEGLQSTFMKIAPDELQCSDATTSTHSPLCDKFAKSCRQMDAGCQGYSGQDGSQEVPAILSDNDLCPASCVGYDEYRKAPSAFDLVRDADTRFDDPTEPTSTYFIPTTASQCTQQDVGCEAFNVVDDTGASDGVTAAYRYLRACEKPGADSETYFTWEGADTVGYQLRTWSLKKDMSTFNLGPRILTKIQADQMSFK